MQTVFLNKVPIEKLSDISAILKSAPGFFSSENLIDKDTGKGTGLVFCRFKETDFRTVKDFLEIQTNWISSIVIQEGTKL